MILSAVVSCFHVVPKNFSVTSCLMKMTWILLILFNCEVYVMGFGDIMSGIGSFISAGIGLNEAYNENSIKNRQAQQALDDSRTIAENNLNFQKDNLAYQKELQQQVFDREDSSYQRTAEDMQKAGLNPLMMSGTDGAGSVINTQAPQQSETPAQMKMQKSQLALQATTQVMNTLKDMSNTMQGIEQSSLARKQLSESQLTELDKLYRSLSKCDPDSQKYKDINAQISKIVLPDSISSLVAMVAKSCGLDYSDIAQCVTDFFNPTPTNEGVPNGQSVVDWLSTPLNGSAQSGSSLPKSLAELVEDEKSHSVNTNVIKYLTDITDDRSVIDKASEAYGYVEPQDLAIVKQTKDIIDSWPKSDINDMTVSDRTKYLKSREEDFMKYMGDDPDKWQDYFAWCRQNPKVTYTTQKHFYLMSKGK